jgi:hypothetical protein
MDCCCTLLLYLFLSIWILLGVGVFYCVRGCNSPSTNTCSNYDYTIGNTTKTFIQNNKVNEAIQLNNGNTCFLEHPTVFNSESASWFASRIRLNRPKTVYVVKLAHSLF